MYDRSRYNWAASHILRSCKVHYGASANGLEQRGVFEFRRGIRADRRRAQLGKIGTGPGNRPVDLRRPGSINIPVGQRRLCTLFAACAYAGATALTAAQPWCWATSTIIRA